MMWLISCSILPGLSSEEKFQLNKQRMEEEICYITWRWHTCLLSKFTCKCSLGVILVLLPSVFTPKPKDNPLRLSKLSKFPLLIIVHGLKEWCILSSNWNKPSTENLLWICILHNAINSTTLTKCFVARWQKLVVGIKQD